MTFENMCKIWRTEFKKQAELSNYDFVLMNLMAREMFLKGVTSVVDVVVALLCPLMYELVTGVRAQVVTFFPWTSTGAFSARRIFRIVNTRVTIKALDISSVLWVMGSGFASSPLLDEGSRVAPWTVCLFVIKCKLAFSHHTCVSCMRRGLCRDLTPQPCSYRLFATWNQLL